MSFTRNGGSKFKKFEGFAKDTKYINGLCEYKVSLKQNIPVSESDVFEKVDSGALNVSQLNFKNFKPGSIVVVKYVFLQCFIFCLNSLTFSPQDLTSSRNEKICRFRPQFDK